MQWWIGPSAARLWLVWNETALYAAATIGMRLAHLAAVFWMGAPLPTREIARMIHEKQMAAFESMSAAGAAMLRRPDKIRPIDLAIAVVKPYRKRTRANVRRLRKRVK